mgnify:CR=1 FL=1
MLRCIYSYTHTHTHLHTPTHTPTPTHTRAQAQAHTHTNTFTFNHTYTLCCMHSEREGFGAQGGGMVEEAVAWWARTQDIRHRHKPRKKERERQRKKGKRRGTGRQARQGHGVPQEHTEEEIHNIPPVTQLQVMDLTECHEQELFPLTFCYSPAHPVHRGHGCCCYCCCCSCRPLLGLLFQCHTHC